MPVEIASIPTKNYAEVIEVRVLVRFYFNNDSTFDGIEMGEFREVLFPWQEVLIEKCLNAIQPAIQ